MPLERILPDDPLPYRALGFQRRAMAEVADQGTNLALGRPQEKLTPAVHDGRGEYVTAIQNRHEAKAGLKAADMKSIRAPSQHSEVMSQSADRPAGEGRTVLEANSGVYLAGRSELVARRRVLTGAALALVLALTGCYPDGVEISAADIEGTWVATGPQGQVAKLVFLPDGTYFGTNLPNGVFHPDSIDPLYGPPDWASEDAISGSWKTGWDATVKIAYITISIEGRSSSTPIEVEEGPKGRRLVRYLGDPDGDRKVSFTKEGGLDHTARAHPS